MSPGAGDEMTDLTRYKWTMIYIACVITIVLILQILDLSGTIT
jgi:hypothetical protein